MRLRASIVSVACLLGFAGTAYAQATPPRVPTGQKDRSNSQFMLRRGDQGDADAAVARGRMRAGDCRAAIVAFDAAIKQTIEPTLRRDRGLCHEKLEHPFPAIDDYRAYLTEVPAAPDAEQIRERLANLEAQVGVGGPSGNSDDNPELGNADQRASFAVDGEGSGESIKRKKKRGDDENEARKHSYDYYVAQERNADEADASPLRRGTGFIIGPYLNIPRFFVGNGVVSKDLAFNVGVTLRYSLGRYITLTSELGYSGIGTANKIGGISGVNVMGGLEARIPLNKYASDAILFRAGPGYEHLVDSDTRASVNFFHGRFGVGYRHVFGSSVGLEAVFDGGPALLIPGGGADNVLVGVVGASTALVVGF